MMERLWLWWQGYVIVRLSGPGLERFLNGVASKEISCWEMRRLATDVILTRILIGDFPHLRTLLWDTQIEMTILDRHGLPFMLRKLRSRAFLGIGLVLSLLLMIYLSSFVWFIEIQGNGTVPLEQLKFVLEREGLRMGVPRKNINPRKLETALLIEFPIFVWTEVEIHGVKVAVSVVEREILATNDDQDADLYAQADGLITKILVLKGTAKVQEGDTVRAGDLLISGEYYDQRGRKQFGVAEGIVEARIWYQGVGEAPFVIWEPTETGKTRPQFILTLGSFAIPLGKSYDEINYRKQAREWSLYLGKAMLPLKWTKVIYHQVEYLPKEISQEEAREIAKNRALDHLRSQGVHTEKIRVERVEESMIQDDEGIHVVLWVEVEEDLGRFSLQ